MSAPVAAIGVALAATAAYSLGLVLEKRALAALPAIDARHAVRLARIVLTSPAWLGGFSLMLCGFGLQAVALALAPVSVVQPALGSGVVILVAASRLLLRERLGRFELGCVLAMAAAIAAIAASAAGPAEPVGQRADAALLTVVAAAAAAAFALAAAALRARARGSRRAGTRAVSFGVSSGLFHGVATLGIKAIPGELAGHPGAFAAALALVGSPYPYLAFGMSAAGLLVFQTGLQRCRVSIVGPVSSVTGSAFFMVAGTWLFGERLPADPARLALRLAGIVVAVLVVLVLSTRPAGDSPRPDPAQRDPGAAAAAGPA